MYTYSELPEGLQGGMKRYLEDGIRAGDFLTACLENDLVGAINRADATNLPHLQSIVKWMWNELPQGCWGSREKVASWHGVTHILAHECEMFISVCCGAWEVGETGFCGKCHDHTGFECEDCGKERDESR